MSMKILHVSDTHLGYSAYRKSTEDGVNQREKDVYDAFEQFIDYAIKTKPDLIIHAGDLFDSVRPNNRAITFSIKQIIRLSKEKIPMLIIAGNHEQPKLRETGHIFSIFDHIENIYPVYNAKYEKHVFKINNQEIIIHAIPQCNSKKEFNDELKKLKPDKKADYNIFVSHGAVTGIQAFSMNEFNELMIPAKYLSKDFDYIALGHYHKYTHITNNAFYSGSTEKLSFTDAPDKKGFLEIELNQKNIKHKFIKIKTRPMIDIEPIECSNMRIDEIMKTIKQKITQIQPKEKIIRLTLKDIPPHVSRGIDFNEIRKLTSNAVQFEIKADVHRDETTQPSSSSKIGALVNEFKNYVETQNIEDKETILSLGIKYIEKIETRDEGK